LRSKRGSLGYGLTDVGELEALGAAGAIQTINNLIQKKAA